MRPIALIAITAAAVVAADVGAAPDSSLRIVPGRAIGKLRLGMTEAEVRRAMGRPGIVVPRRAGFGLRSHEYQYGLGAYTVRLSGRPGRLRAVRIGTSLVRERTPAGVGVGSRERAIARAYRGLRCERLRTERHGSFQLVTTIQRECTLFAASGRRTIFTTDVRERMFEVISPAMWSRRAIVVEVSVATAG